jgi:MinD superfamily P-loop ATPase
MKQVTILSGKGGTGKTSITGCFAALADEPVMADCDVDASNLHLILNPKIRETMEFKGLNVAEIDPEKCTRCGLCMQLCRFNAIHEYTVDPIHCEGCKVCVVNCPAEAINFNERVCGYAYLSETVYGPMSHARLTPGMENSGKLVTLVRQNAAKLAEETGRGLVLVDGPPGIGCPVIASLSNVDAAVAVVEPTLSGIHDLKRALELLEHFQIKPSVIVNKYDLNMENTASIRGFCEEHGIPVLGLVPFDENVTKAMVQAQPVTVFSPDSPASIAIREAWVEFSSFLGL